MKLHQSVYPALLGTLIPSNLRLSYTSITNLSTYSQMIFCWCCVCFSS